MPAFFEYIRNITYYLVFASVVGIFAPVGKYKKFVNLVMGFVLLLLMVQPLAGFFAGRDIPVTQWFAGPIPTMNGGLTGNLDAVYASWWDDYFSTAFQSQLEAQLSRLLEANGYTLYSAEFTYSADFSQIESVSVHVSVSPTYSPGERVPFIRIQPPRFERIQIGETPPAETCPHQEKVKTLISEFYNLPKSHIDVKVD